MSEESHTPGPWTVRSRGDTHLVVVDDGRQRARVVAETWTSTRQSLENATLIAAAPDLLEALERTRAWMGSVMAGFGIGSKTDAGKVLQHADAALDKARASFLTNNQQREHR